MLDRNSASWFYPKPTGDLGRDRNAQTLQFACLLFAIVIGVVAVLDTIDRERVPPVLGMAVVGLVAAGAMNRAGNSAWAARAAILAVLLTAILLVFPGLLLLSVMLLDRTRYVTTAGIVLLAVAVLGIAEQHGLTGAIPWFRSPTSYDSILIVDLILLVFALIGSRIARDVESNVFDLRSVISQLSAANVELTESAKALRDSELKYRRLYESITDAVVAVDMTGHIIETNPAYETMLGYSGAELRQRSYQELTPEPWHDFEARIFAEQILVLAVI